MNGRASQMIAIAVMVGLSLGSCSMMAGAKKKNKGQRPDDHHGLRAYQQAGGRVAGIEGSAAGSPAVSLAYGVAPRGEGITPEEDIVWAPENPEEAIGGDLEDLWKRPENKKWHQSHREAFQQSRQTGRPVLIWFTDSRFSPACRSLSEELFSTSKFEDWASGNLVRLRVDKTLPAKEKNSDIKARKIEYAKKLNKRYGVHGSPTVMILMPGGEVSEKYRGYKKGESDYYWARMKQAVVMAKKAYGKWLEKYESRGYRFWTSRDGRKTFAKLYRFRPGSVTLIDPDGKRGTTSLKKLCDADQAWIMLQKKKYEANKRR